MTIDEIKSVSIIQFLESQGHQKSYVFKGSYWYLSPFRSEQSPSFNVNPTKNGSSDISSDTAIVKCI